VGILFAHLAHQIRDASVIVPVGMLFVAFCLASSCVYLLNDIADREEDARHPVKRTRPIASGRLSVGTARVASIACAVAALAIAWILPRAPRVTPLEIPSGLVVLVAYLGLNVAYTSWLKHIAPVDHLMEELYSRYANNEPLLTDEDKGVTKVRNGDTVIIKRSMIDGILAHTSAAIKELAAINAEMVGDMHRRMVDRASSQEEACSDLAKKMIQFGEDYIQTEE
jgi:hypothetical protein